MSWFYYIITFLYGSIIGSFLNVIILRVPEKKSIAYPASHCPSCNEPLKWWMNIPILSFFLLKRKCAYCEAPISWQYPIVEFISALFTLLLFLKLGFTLSFFFYLFSFYLLLTITIIDINTQLILNLLLMIWGVLVVAAAFANLFVIEWNWILGVIGALLGGGFLLFIAYIGEKLFHKESLGMGDVKFAVVAGFLLGADLIIPMILLSSIIALMVIIPFYGKKIGEKNIYIPFGPFLCAATFILMFYGDVYRFYSNKLIMQLLW